MCEIGGSLHARFKSTRGVRQRDPISPGLFVLVAEYFGKGLYSLFQQGRHRFFQAGGIRVPYLAFADDVIIFTRLSRETLQAVSAFFKQYQQYSGQKINVSKSGFVCSSGVLETQVELVSRILGFQRQFFPLVYLGVPISRGRSSTVDFDGIIAKVRARVCHWSAKLLSMGGKLILIKHVLNSMPLYLLQVLKPPKAVLVALGRIFNSFLWDKSHDAKRTHWASWERLCFPTEEGGGSKTVWYMETANRYTRVGGGADYMESGTGNVEIPFDLDGHDQILWAKSATGFFSLTSAWELCRQRRGGLSLAGMVWNRGTPLKFSFFAWRLMNNFVALDSVLRRRGLPLVSWCSCCLAEAETLPHLFVNGPVAREVWGHFAGMFGILHLPSDDIQLMWREWATSLTRIPAHHIRCVLPLVVTWFIWQGRNKARFEGQAFSAQEVIVEVSNFLHDLGRAKKLDKAQFTGDQDCVWARLASGGTRKRRPVVVTWAKPPPLQYKLNTDASVVNGRASGGGVLRDSFGRVIVAFYKEFGEKGVLQAEALAGGWLFCNVLRRIRRLLDQVAMSFTHIFRVANMVADRLAALQGGPNQVFDSLQQLPREVRGCIAMDTAQIPSYRLVPQ
ncbi:uncharacterized protein LOC113771278 [Coffea eugenioides]|uniref:uncharacterized protein LOC113771278 n=1 Tax=Coffea eugenioides TaxID=49369 RepID=UPI000F612894|nr:uncharacterized protein LOC113771278 [Coffea eugenioides]